MSEIPAAEPAGPAPPRAGWYHAGLFVQLLGWCGLFFALLVAYACSGEPTDFRYVGF